MQGQDSAHAPHQRAHPMVHPRKISCFKSAADDRFLQVRQAPGRLNQIKLRFQLFVETSLQSCGEHNSPRPFPAGRPCPARDGHIARVEIFHDMGPANRMALGALLRSANAASSLVATPCNMLVT
jgi:hypothetical protein